MRHPDSASAGTEELSLGHLWRTLLRRRWIILGVTATTVLLAGLITWLQRPLYQAEATILIAGSDEKLGLGRLLPSSLGQLAGLPGPAGGIPTDMALLESRQIAEAVVDSLDLQVKLVEPQRPRSAVLSVLDAPSPMRTSAFELNSTGSGTYAVRQTEGLRVADVPDRVSVGRPFRLAGATLALVPGLMSTLPERIRIELRPVRNAVAELQEDLVVEQPEPGAQIIAVQYESSDSVLAAAVPNVATQSFLDYKDQTATAESRNKVRFLREQIAQYGEELREAEGRLQSFREEAQIVEPKSQAGEEIRRLAQLQTEREALLTERESLQRLLARIESQPVRPGGPSPYRQLVAFPSFLSNSAVQSVLQLLNELENERANRLVLRTEQSIDVQGIDQRIRELELQLYQLARNYLDGLNTQLAAVGSTLGRFDAQLEKVPAKEVRFARLTREQELLENVYTLLQTSLTEEEIRGAEHTPELRLIDPALVPEGPSSPRPLINLLLGGVLGLVLGVGAVLVREASDTRVRTTQDALAAAPGIPLVGTVPRVIAPGTSYFERWGAPRRLSPRKRNGTGRPRLVTTTAPYSAAAEAYRELRTNLTRADGNAGVARVLTVTSPAPGDGKSTVAANLAVAMAQQGLQILLVDGDLRKGMLHELLGASRDPGVTEVALGEAALAETVQQIEVDGAGTHLDFLSTGRLPRNPSELLGSEAVRELLQALREQYQVVIVDAPPVNVVTDAAVLATLSDTTLLVARAGLTDQSALYEAAAKLDQVDARLGGVVLNNAALRPDVEDYYTAVSSDPPAS